MTDGQKKPSGVQAPDSEIRLSVDISRAEDLDHFSFAAVPIPDEARVWRASGDVVRGKQGLKITRLEIGIDPELPTGITGSLMRQIPLGTLLDYVRAKIALSGAPKITATMAAHKPAHPGGRTPMSDELLCSVATAYLRETAPGQPSGAVRRIAEEFDRPEETIRTWIARARKSGWLGPSVKGRAGAEPGPRFFEQAMFERVDGSERVLTTAGTSEYTRLSEAEGWRRVPDEETARYVASIRERHDELKSRTDEAK